jgi:hypothetical protein
MFGSLEPEVVAEVVMKLSRASWGNSKSTDWRISGPLAQLVRASRS